MEPSSRPSPYYDYVVLLGCLVLFPFRAISSFDMAGWTTTWARVHCSPQSFFVAAYRFDHIGVLSLAHYGTLHPSEYSGIAQKWTSGDFIQQANLHITAIIFPWPLRWQQGHWTHALSKRKHFTFTYFTSFLIFFGGTLAALFLESDYNLCSLTYAGSAAGYWVRKNKSFSFCFTRFFRPISATTYWLARTIFEYEESLWFITPSFPVEDLCTSSYDFANAFQPENEERFTIPIRHNLTVLRDSRQWMEHYFIRKEQFEK